MTSDMQCKGEWGEIDTPQSDKDAGRFNGRQTSKTVDDPDEGEVTSAAAKMIFAMFNESGIVLDDPKLLKEARIFPDWPQWENAVNTKLEQLDTLGTWELLDPPDS
ncbi:hypothetical protein BDR06DRAFT_969489 [Suillus hirtellus]|nr:hypothetical protein BDR06DRAFT_969489 [Suillus hirtellus]